MNYSHFQIGVIGIFYLKKWNLRKPKISKNFIASSDEGTKGVGI